MGGIPKSGELDGIVKPSWVEAVVEPYDRGHDRYQAYYRRGLAEYCAASAIPFQESGARFPNQLRLLARIRASAKLNRLLPRQAGRRLVDFAARTLGAHLGDRNRVGAYIYHRATGDVRIAVDPYDSGDLHSQDLLEWADFYFKTNYWPDRTYPAKVRPIANLNPEVLDRMAYLRTARNSEKEWDLFGFFRVWGGSDELEGVEHNLALFEALSRVKCRKKLLAFLVCGDIGAAAERLKKAGVAYTTAWVPLAEVWRTAARSRLNIVRHGMHECVPWRMTETLAMGGCPVLDYAARTRWHVPLEENVHYLNLQAPYRPSMPGDIDPRSVAERVESWLADRDLIPVIQRNTARYFDEYLAPEKLGRHMIETATREHAAGVAQPKDTAA